MLLCDLEDDFPNIIDELREFWYRHYGYHLTYSVFDNAPLKEQIIVLNRFLGYPVVIPKGMKKKDAAIQAIDRLKEYQRLKIKEATEGIPDILQEMLHMDEKERLKLIPQLNDKVLYPSLRHALIKLGEDGSFIQSLRDALVKRPGYEKIPVEQDDDDFYNNIKPVSDVPF